MTNLAPSSPNPHDTAKLGEVSPPSTATSHEPNESWWGRLAKLIGFRQNETNLRESFDEILEEFGHDSEPVAPAGREMIENIIKSKSYTAADLMIPRADIVSLPLDAKLEEVMAVVKTKRFSRYPIYQDDADDVIGFIHIKDILASLPTNSRRLQLKKIIKPVLVIAPNMPLMELLIEMRETRRHLALVVDEFGGIDGLVTIEDLIEEIIGEMDEVVDLNLERQFKKLDGQRWRASGRLLLEDLEDEVTGLGQFLTEEEREEDIDTLAGLLFAISGRVPRRGEIIQHLASGIEFTVLEADARQVRSIMIDSSRRVTKLSPKLD